MKVKFQQLQVLFMALLTGQLLFFGVVYFFLLPEESAIIDPGAESIFEILVPVALIGALGLIYLVTKLRKQQAAELALSAKVDHFRITSIIRMAILEGANLLAIVALLIENKPSTYLLYIVVGMLAFIFFRPSLRRFIKEYELSQREQGEVAD